MVARAAETAAGIEGALSAAGVLGRRARGAAPGAAPGTLGDADSAGTCGRSFGGSRGVAGACGRGGPRDRGTEGPRGGGTKGRRGGGAEGRRGRGEQGRRGAVTRKLGGGGRYGFPCGAPDRRVAT